MVRWARADGTAAAAIVYSVPEPTTMPVAAVVFVPVIESMMVFAAADPVTVTSAAMLVAVTGTVDWDMTPVKPMPPVIWLALIFVKPPVAQTPVPPRLPPAMRPVLMVTPIAAGEFVFMIR